MRAPTHQALIATSYLVTSSFLSIKVDLDLRLSTNYAFKMDGFYLGHRKAASNLHKTSKFSLCSCVIITANGF